VGATGSSVGAVSTGSVGGGATGVGVAQAPRSMEATMTRAVKIYRVFLIVIFLLIEICE
jgi:hypothetical protein